MFLGRQALEVGEELAHGGEHVVVEGGGAEQEQAGVQDVGDDVAVVGAPQVVHQGVDPGVHEALGQGLGQQSGAVPHGVVNHQGLGLHIARGPVLVGREDPGGVLAVDQAVVRGDDLEGEAELGDV